MKNLRYSILLIAILLLPSISSAQDYDTLWSRIYDRGYDYWDTVGYAQVTTDGGFILAGVTYESGVSTSNIYLKKIDSDGTEEWSRIYESPNWESAYHVLQTWDGGYLMSCHTDKYSSAWSKRIWIIKTDSDGDSLWSHPFTELNQDGFPFYAIETVDSGYAITGWIYVPGYSIQAFLLKLDKDGEYEWHHHYGSYGYQEGHYVTQLPDSGYIIAGNNDNSDYDFWALRTDKDGVKQWDSTYSLYVNFDAVYGGCRDEDGVVMVGINAGKSHVHKIDFDGHTVWSKSISRYATGEQAFSICNVSTGGYMVGGWVGVPAEGRNFCFTRLDEDGDTLWTYAPNSDTNGNSYDHGRVAMETPDGNFALAGLIPMSSGAAFGLVKIGPAPICGDVNGDGIVNVLDIIYYIEYKFKSGPEPVNMAMADVNGDGIYNILDIIDIIKYKFTSGPDLTCGG